MSLHVSAYGRPGQELASVVMFHSNDPTRPEGLITAKVKLKGGVNTVPTSVIFGTVPLNGEARQVVDVLDGGVGRRSIAKVVSNRPDRFTVRLVPLQHRERSKVPDSVIARLEVSALSQEPGDLNGDILIYLANEDRAPDSVPVLGVVAADAEVVPSQLVLPRESDSGRVYYAYAICRCMTGKTLALTAESVPPGLSVQFSAVEGSPEQQRIRIELDKAHMCGTSDAASNKTVRLRARAGNRERSVAISVLCRAREED